MSNTAIRHSKKLIAGLKTYQVKVDYTFSGVVDVRAGTKTEAKNIVNSSFGGVNIEIGKSSWTSPDEESTGIVDWDFGMKSEKTHIR